MNTIRKYAKANGHEIIGKLTRHPEWEYEDTLSGCKKHGGAKAYADEAGNEYYISKGGISIVTADGGII